MATNDSLSERRLFTRFPIKDHVLIAIDSRRGELIDISFGGLAFRYSGPTPWPAQTAGPAMLCGAADFCLQLPLLLVADLPLHPAEAGAQGIILRRCSMQFGKLSATQLIQLVAFIRDNTLEQELPEAGILLPSA